MIYYSVTATLPQSPHPHPGHWVWGPQTAPNVPCAGAVLVGVVCGLTSSQSQVAILTNGAGQNGGLLHIYDCIVYHRSDSASISGSSTL